jgi:predicted RNA-binding protein Jag
MQKLVTGKTIEEAKAEIVRGLNLDDFESYNIEVIQEPSKGFLGLGSKDAQVRLVVKTDKVAKAVHLVKELAGQLGFKPDFKEAFNQNSRQLVLKFDGPESAKMASQLGRSAHKLEFLVNTIVNRKDREGYLRTVFEFDSVSSSSERGRSRSSERPRPRPSDSKESRDSKEGQDRDSRSTSPRTSQNARPSSDSRPPRSDRPKSSQGSRERDDRRPRNPRDDRSSQGNRGRSFSGERSKPAREQFLISTATSMAEKVIETKNPMRLNPMNSYDRRIIHAHLNEKEHITTTSEGEGDRRCVVIQFVE